MLTPDTTRRSAVAADILAGRAAFLENFSADEHFSRYLDAPRFALRAVSSGLVFGYRRAGDEEIIETLASHYLQLGRQIRCLEIGAGVTAQWSEVSGHRGAPWLSRYLARHHSDKFEIIASDIGRSNNDSYLSMSAIHWMEGAEAWQVRAETFALWKEHTSPALYQRLRQAFSSGCGCGVALPASALGLEAADFRPAQGAGSFGFTEASFKENIVAIPVIVPALEKSMFNLRFEEGLDISSPPPSLGQFDVIFGRHLGIAKDTLLGSIPRLAALLAPRGKIFLYTDYSPYTVQLTYENGRLEHTFPD